MSALVLLQRMPPQYRRLSALAPLAGWAVGRRRPDGLSEEYGFEKPLMGLDVLDVHLIHPGGQLRIIARFVATPRGDGTYGTYLCKEVRRSWDARTAARQRGNKISVAVAMHIMDGIIAMPEPQS